MLCQIKIYSAYGESGFSVTYFLFILTYLEPEKCIAAVEIIKRLPAELV